MFSTLRRNRENLVRVENIVGNGENTGLQHFHRFRQCFLLCPRQKPSLPLYLISIIFLSSMKSMAFQGFQHVACSVMAQKLLPYIFSNSRKKKWGARLIAGSFGLYQEENATDRSD